MIAALTGVLSEKSPNGVIIDVHGVGYRVYTSLHTFCRLGAVGEPVSLQIHTHVREDTLALFGFAGVEERKAFEALISVSGIGPKLAINILSGITVGEFAEAVARGDVARLTKIPGIGKKLAERLALELKDKIAPPPPGTSPAPSSADPLEEDAVSALLNLGYRRDEAREAVRQTASAVNQGAGRPLGDLIRESLRRLSGR